jgi:NhaA family Na+:H+ antiporter
MSKLFKEFFTSEKAGGMLLLLCTIISLLIANSAFGPSYIHFWERSVDLSFASVQLNYPMGYWVNDGLMAIFFLMIGLEIERELFIGELADIKKASLPIAAAIGGMAVPALIHFLFNAGTSTQSGFGIPMATDIAFALGMLSLLGKKVPASLKIFLTALAIIDDLGAILIIAIFYTDTISWAYLGIAGGIYIVLLIMGRLKVYRLWLYLLPGVIMWYCMLRSGVHPTISGVLLAFAIPFGKGEEKSCSYRLQHFLHKPVAFIILPIFALANTGLLVSTGWYNELGHHNNLGIMLGLVIGKPVGIFLFCLLLVKLKWSSLPEDVLWKHIAGVGILGGIGFTMSIFISNLAFKDSGIIQSSKITVLISSGIACIIGLIVLYITRNKEEQV